MEKMTKIIVIKIGSSILLTRREKLDEFRIAHIASQVASLQEDGFGVVLVVSGAVACGHKFVAFAKEEHLMRQAAAGIGQAIVTSIFTEIFAKKHLNLAQILLTKNDFKTIAEKQKIKNLLMFYLQTNSIPMINENDILDLNSFGGNDFLAVEIAKLLTADKMLMLSTMKGSAYGIGGGATKLEAINHLAKENIETAILDGKKKNILLTV